MKKPKEKNAISDFVSGIIVNEPENVVRLDEDKERMLSALTPKEREGVNDDNLTNIQRRIAHSMVESWREDIYVPNDNLEYEIALDQIDYSLYPEDTGTSTGKATIIEKHFREVAEDMEQQSPGSLGKEGAGRELAKRMNAQAQAAKNAAESEMIQELQKGEEGGKQAGDQTSIQKFQKQLEGIKRFPYLAQIAVYSMMYTELKEQMIHKKLVEQEEEPGAQLVDVFPNKGVEDYAAVGPENLLIYPSAMAMEALVNRKFKLYRGVVYHTYKQYTIVAVDASGSMGGGNATVWKQALGAVISRMDVVWRGEGVMKFYFFGDHLMEETCHTVRTRDDVKKLYEYITTYSPNGGTSFDQTIAKMVSITKDDLKRGDLYAPELMLITDGQAGISHDPRIMEMEVDGVYHKCKMHSIVVGLHDAEKVEVDPLKKFTNATGGLYIQIDEHLKYKFFTP